MNPRPTWKTPRLMLSDRSLGVRMSESPSHNIPVNAKSVAKRLANKIAGSMSIVRRIRSVIVSPANPKAAASAKSSPRPRPIASSLPAMTARPSAAMPMASEVVQPICSLRSTRPSNAAKKGAAARINSAFATLV